MKKVELSKSEMMSFIATKFNERDIENLLNIAGYTVKELYDLCTSRPIS